MLTSYHDGELTTLHSILKQLTDISFLINTWRYRYPKAGCDENPEKFINKIEVASKSIETNSAEYRAATQPQTSNYHITEKNIRDDHIPGHSDIL